MYIFFIFFSINFFGAFLGFLIVEGGYINVENKLLDSLGWIFE